MNTPVRPPGIVLALACLVACVGCQTPPPAPQVRPRQALQQRPQRFIAGRSVMGLDMVCHVFGNGDVVVLIMATIHGNEPAGTPLVRRLADHLTRYPELIDDRRVVLLPVANPDGMARGTRYNANGVDLNRNFPASNWSRGKSHGSAPLSEPESRAIYELIARYQPHRIVTIHQPLNRIDYDGPARALAHAMAGRCDLPVKKLNARPGSLGSYAGVERGVPVVTVELPRSASALDASALWDRYGDMLLAAVRFP